MSPQRDAPNLQAAAADLLEALRLHVAYQAIAKDRNGDDTKAMAFGRFLTARDAAIALAEAAPEMVADLERPVLDDAEGRN